MHTTIPVAQEAIDFRTADWVRTLISGALSRYAPNAEGLRPFALSYSLTRDGDGFTQHKGAYTLWLQNGHELYTLELDAALSKFFHQHPDQIDQVSKAVLLAQMLDSMTHPLRGSALKAANPRKNTLSAGGHFVTVLIMADGILLAGPSFEGNSIETEMHPKPGHFVLVHDSQSSAHTRLAHTGNSLAFLRRAVRTRTSDPLFNHHWVDEDWWTEDMDDYVFALDTRAP